MLELASFNHMTNSAVQIESRDKILLMMSWKNIEVKTFILKFHSRRPRVANFDDIIKSGASLLKQPVKTQSISVFLDISKFAEKTMMSAELKRYNRGITASSFISAGYM